MFRIHQGRLLFKPMQPPQSNAQSKKKKGAQQQPSGPAVVWSWPPSRPPVLEFQEVWSKIQSAHFKNKVDYSAEPPIPITKDLRPWPPSARGRDESSPKGQGPHPGIPEPEMWSQTYTGACPWVYVCARGWGGGHVMVTALCIQLSIPVVLVQPCRAAGAAWPLPHQRSTLTSRSCLCALKAHEHHLRLGARTLACVARPAVLAIATPAADILCT
jgi:hypothetical protein